MIFKFVIIAFVSSVIASMGIGGGSIFILLSSLFNLFPYKEVKFYNLFMFIITGFIATIFNIKNKKVNLKEIIKIVLPVIFGSMFGIFLLKFIDDNILRNIFYIIIMFFGIYEIISSLIKIKNAKDNKKFAKGAVIGMIAGTVLGVMNSENIKTAFNKTKHEVKKMKKKYHM